MRKLIYLVFILFLVSCTMAPDLELKKVESPEVFKNEFKQLVTDSVIPNQWWKQFDDALLVSYIDSMLANNLDMAIMAERLKQLEAIADITSSQQYPSANAGASYGDSKSFMVNNFIPNGKPYIELANESYGLNLSMMFNLDVWGKIRSLKLAAMNDVIGLQHDLKAFYQSMIVNTISMYVEVQSLKESIGLTQRTVETYKNDLVIQERRYRNGIGTSFNVALSKQLLTANQARLIAEEEALTKMKYNYSLLLGRYPTELNVKNSDLSLSFLPSSIPSKILKDRHDVQKSYYSVESARYRIGAARADFFPQISLSASTGWNTSTADDLFDGDLLGNNIGVNVSQNLFSGFATASTVDQRWAEYNIAVKTYQKTVLEAFKDVELAFVNVKATEGQFEAFTKNRQASKNALRFMQKRYTSGISDYQQFMDVKRSDFSSEANLITAKKNKLLSKVNLILKLGGNW